MKIRLISAVIGSLAASVALVGCAVVAGDVGPQTSQEREIEDVTAVSLETGGALTIRTGSEPALTVTAGEDVLELLTSEVRDGVLVLDTRRGRFGSFGRVTYDLVLPAVDAIRVNGSGDIDAELDPTDTLKVVVNGSGDVTARGVEVDDLSVELSGSGRVELAGSASRQSVNLDGSGDYAAGDLDSEEAAVSLSGSGTADLHVTDTLDAEISGSGAIIHSGGAQVTGHVSGSGDIEEK